MSDSIPDVEVKAVKRSIWERVSVVWLVPVAALVIALGVAWQSYMDRGPVIEIIFDNASGISPNETELRFRNVAVGLVEGVSFTEALDQVVVEVRLDRKVAPYVDDEAQFWVVRPEVTTQGVSGLDTVLSGVYLQGVWDEVPSDLTYTFEGLSEPPLLADGRQGLTITLRSSDGSLSGNTPMLYKGVEVGRIGPANVSPDGFSVEARAVVYAPYDNLVTDSTRFWDTSGFSLSIGTSGAAVNFDSLASLIAGGVTFDTFVSGAPLARDGTVFTVYADDASARASVFDRNDGVTLDLIAIFDGNVAGLTTGAAVELNGLRIGEVSGLNGVVETTPAGATRVRLQTVLSIRPSRLGLEGETNAEDALAFLQAQVTSGLRARLVTASLLTGGLKVQLLTPPNVKPAAIDMDYTPFPRIPTTSSDITDVQASAQGTLDRINNLPIEELLQSATNLMTNASVLIGSADTQRVPGDISALLADIRAVVGSESVQGLPVQLSGIMTELETTIAEVRFILATVEEQSIVARLGGAIDAATTLSTQIELSLQGVPDLLVQVEALAATANELPLNDLVTQISALSVNANTLLASEAAQALPDQIGRLTAELEGTVTEVRSLVAGLNSDEASARLLTAVDAASAAATSLDASLVGVPELVDRINVIAADAAGMDLPQLVAAVNGLVSSADTFLAAEATQAIPAELNAALAELTIIMASVNDNDAVARLLTAVDATAEAAAGVDAAIAGVPALVEQINAVAADAQGLELDTLIARVTSLIESADTLVSAEATLALPTELNASLAQLRGILAELSEGGAIENTNAALLSARTAADEIALAAQQLPALLERANALLAQADTTLSGFEDTSPAIRDARAALNEITRAAQAVTSLARAIERRPNSLLVGR